MPRLSRRLGSGIPCLAAGIFLSAAIVRAGVSVTPSGSDYIINNGDLSVTFHPAGSDITSIKINGDSTQLLASGQTLDPGFSSYGTATTGTLQDPSGNYVDIWRTTQSMGTKTNPVTTTFHYVLFANDPSISVYEVVNHSATDPAASISSGQYYFRGSNNYFYDTYQQNVGPNNSGAQQTVGTYAPASPQFSGVTGQAGRNVQDSTYDLSNSGLVGDWGGQYSSKYDYSSYEQFHQGQMMYGSNYAVSFLLPSDETLTGGPTKQNLNFSNPSVLSGEYISGDFGNSDYDYVPPQGVASSKLYGPYVFRVTPTGGQSASQLFQAGINSLTNYQSLYASDTELTGTSIGQGGYVPDSQRGRVGGNLGDSASGGWSQSITNNTVVLSDPNTNFQESTQGFQYWTQVNSNGAFNIANVAPGTYRMSIYQLGQWGETRVDGVTVRNGKLTVPIGTNFTPENFSTQAPIWTIGTPNRSANEFLNGHDSSGQDQRQFDGSYDYWSEEQALGTPGRVVYYATAVGSTPATNNPSKWIANQWLNFDPGEYDSKNGTSDNYQSTAPGYVRDASHGGSGVGPANYKGAPWEVHFTTTAAQRAQGQFIDLSVGLAAFQSSLTVTLNGTMSSHTATWHYSGNESSNAAYQSGDAGFYKWIVFQFPTSFLYGDGADDEFTFGVSKTDGVMYDALRMEITNTSADPATRGWYDYAFVNAGSLTQSDPQDSIGQPANEVLVPVPEPASIGVIGAGILLLARRSRRN